MRGPDEFLVFGSPLIGEEEIEEVVATLRSGWIGTGPRVATFEEEFAHYVGGSSTVAVSSCTAALHLSILASGIGPGDEVITTPLTFAATANAIIHAGATPVLADIDLRTMNVDPSRIAERITDRTAAIVPVHFAGRPCDMDSILELARRRGLAIIEDCAHAIESTYHGRHAGTFGDFGCFSFYATKNVVTGEGGMVVTADATAAARVKTLALHGMTKDAWRRYSDDGYRHYQVVECGYKYNMMDLQAAMGIHQLRRIEESYRRRDEIWRLYDAELADLAITLPAETEHDTRHARHLYTVLIDEERCGVRRDDFLDRMTAQGIGVGVHYLSLPEHPYYQERLGWQPEEYPNAMFAGRQTVSLPLSAKLSDRDVDDVLRAVHRVLGSD